MKRRGRALRLFNKIYVPTCMLVSIGIPYRGKGATANVGFAEDERPLFRRGEGRKGSGALIRRLERVPHRNVSRAAHCRRSITEPPLSCRERLQRAAAAFGNGPSVIGQLRTLSGSRPKAAVSRHWGHYAIARVARPFAAPAASRASRSTDPHPSRIRSQALAKRPGVGGICSCVLKSARTFLSLRARRNSALRSSRRRRRFAQQRGRSSRQTASPDN